MPQAAGVFRAGAGADFYKIVSVQTEMKKRRVASTAVTLRAGPERAAGSREAAQIDDLTLRRTL